MWILDLNAFLGIVAGARLEIGQQLRTQVYVSDHDPAPFSE